MTRVQGTGGNEPIEELVHHSRNISHYRYPWKIVRAKQNIPSSVSYYIVAIIKLPSCQAMGTYLGPCFRVDLPHAGHHARNSIAKSSNRIELEMREGPLKLAGGFRVVCGRCWPGRVVAVASCGNSQRLSRCGGVKGVCFCVLLHQTRWI